MGLQEWGNPVANKTTYDLLLSYSPTDNVKQQAYPSMLAIGGDEAMLASSSFPHSSCRICTLQHDKRSACPGPVLPRRSDGLSEVYPECRAA